MKEYKAETVKDPYNGAVRDKFNELLTRYVSEGWQLNSWQFTVCGKNMLSGVIYIVFEREMKENPEEDPGKGNEAAAG